MKSLSSILLLTLGIVLTAIICYDLAYKKGYQEGRVVAISACLQYMEQVKGIKSIKHPDCELLDYQIEVEMDGVLVYDRNRYLGFLPFSNSPLDSLIFKDNQ